MQSKTRLWLHTATHTATDFYVGAVAALLPFFITERHYDYAAVAGITLAATSISSVVQPVFGMLADRYRMRWLILAGMLTAGTGIAVSGLVADNYLSTWVAIAVSGVGVAAYHPAGTMLARDYGGGTNRSLAVFSVGGNVGVALAPVGILLTVGVWGLEATPWLMIPAAVMAVIYLIGLRTAHVVKTVKVDPEVPILSPRRDDWRGFGVMTIALILWSVAYVATNSFVSLYQIDRFGITPAAAAVALTVFPIAGALGTLVGGIVADRFGRMRVIRAGYALAAASMAMIIVAPTPLIVVIGAALLGATMFLPFSPQITLSHAFLPNRVGLASGVTLGLSLSLGGLLVPLVGELADATSVQTSFLALAAVLVVAFVVTCVLRDPAVVRVPEDSSERVAP